MQLNSNDAYKQWLAWSGHTSVPFLPFECAAEQHGGNIKLAELNKSLHEFSSSAVVGVRDWISVNSFTDLSELKIIVLHKATFIVLSEIEEICPQELPGSSG